MSTHKVYADQPIKWASARLFGLDSRLRRWQWSLLRLTLVTSDVGLTAAAFWLAYRIRFQAHIPFFEYDFIPQVSFYRRLFLVLLWAWPLLFWLNGLYSRRLLLGGTQEYAQVFRTVSVGMLLLIVAGFLEPDLIFARGWLVVAWGVTFALVALGRFIVRRLVYGLRRRGFFLTPALIVGANDEAISLAEQLLSWRSSGLYLVGFVADGFPPRMPLTDHLTVLGGLRDLSALRQQYDVEEIILATSALSRADIVTLFKRYSWQENLTVRLSAGLYEMMTTGLEVKELASTPLVQVRRVRLTGLDQFLKAALDYAIAIPLVVLTWPLMLLIMLAIRLDSPGPAIYRRRVLGLHGRPFDAFKFRTMYVDGDEILAQQPELQAELKARHKLKQDPRVTRIGRILRQTSLDELPQIINVLVGQMSMVGPRMISPPELQLYDQWEMNLLTMRPGITGLWQVSGRSDLSYAERVRLDMHYIRNWTIWLDLYVLFVTLPAVVRRRGAY